MSTKPPNKGSDGFKMPETFSFGLEPREEPEPETIPEVQPFQIEERKCQHTWARAPEEKQTVAAEDKVVWCCMGCGELKITYAWQKP